jgi:signal transduction histidine kinase
MAVMVDVSHFKRLNENMTMFLQTVSHDLRSPLTAAKGFVDMLPMVGEVNERQTLMLEKVTTSIVDMTNLVEKVLDAGRLDPEMGAYEIRREMCDPAEIVEKVASSLSPAATKKNLTLEAEAGDGIPIMNLDIMMIERSLTNLVENAIKYTPEGGSVWVRVMAENHRLTFSVEDNGYGIPQDKLPILFDRGSRVRREEHKAIRGSGLGLFIVKNVAQQHGGDAYVESVEGEGSIFRIMIPLSGANMIAGT